MAKINRLTTNEVEAVNRAEATALLIRAGYRVYRPEADCYGEDLILRALSGELRAVQLKARPEVNKRRYGGKSLWMLFPDPKSGTGSERRWFLVPHDKFYNWTKRWHGRAACWKQAWSYPSVSKKLGRFLHEFTVPRTEAPPKKSRD
jgi:hypothetical protein